MTEETKEFIKMKTLKSDKAFGVFLDPDFDSLEEYRQMIKLLEGNKFEITDYSKIHEENGEFNPPTFGE